MLSGWCDNCWLLSCLCKNRLQHVNPVCFRICWVCCLLAWNGRSTLPQLMLVMFRIILWEFPCTSCSVLLTLSWKVYLKAETARCSHEYFIETGVSRQVMYVLKCVLQWCLEIVSTGGPGTPPGWTGHGTAWEWRLRVLPFSLDCLRHPPLNPPYHHVQGTAQRVGPASTAGDLWPPAAGWDQGPYQWTPQHRSSQILLAERLHSF